MTEPLWEPAPDHVQTTHMARFIDRIGEGVDAGVRDYETLYRFSVDHPERFWNAIWDYAGVRADRRGDRVSENWPAMPGTRWYPDARLNFAENLLRRNDASIAIEFAGEGGFRRSIRWAELNREVARLAAGLRKMGVQPGDRVAGYLPNLPETVIAMLAASSVGAIWSSCSPDFGVRGVLDRFGQIEPRVLFAAAAYRYNGKTHDCLGRIAEMMSELPTVERVVVTPYAADSLELDALGDRAVSWEKFGPADPEPLRFEPLPFDHPLYILYSSGTTGVPKCIVHGAGGTLLQHLKELLLHTDVRRGDRLFYFTTCGWMMWNWLVSGLAAEATLVLYDGSPFYPDGNVLWDLADEVGICQFGTSAKWISACDKAGIRPRESHELSSLRAILSTGSPLLPESFDYVYRDVRADVQLSSISGGTDIVSCFALGNPLLPVRRGELQCRGLGMAVEIRNDDGEVVVDQTGELTCSKPFPSMPVRFWNDPDGARYRLRAADRARRRGDLRSIRRDAQSRRRAHRHRRDLPPGGETRRDPGIALRGPGVGR
jgi:acetoacetyl-CoA synthetase